MPAPTITPLPTPPSRSTDPTNFAIEADAFVAALPEFVTDANAQASYLDNLATTTEATLEGLVDDADGFATAAAASAAAALTSENNAEAAATAAAATADTALWVSGTTYAIGDNVFSPIDFQTYRRKTNGAGTTDPSLDSTNWQILTFSAVTPLSVPGNSSSGAELRLAEDTDNGTNYVALKAPDALGANVTFTLPSADGSAGNFLQTNGSGGLTFSAPPAGGFSNFVVFTSSGSWTAPAGITKALVTVVGGGGGANTGSGDGGTSSFVGPTTTSATGGIKGTSAAGPGAGGIGSGGDLNGRGGNGLSGSSGPYGWGGASIYSLASGANNATGILGAGGGGGVSGQGGGGGGHAIKLYDNIVGGTTYTVTIGAGGTSSAGAGGPGVVTIMY